MEEYMLRMITVMKRQNEMFAELVEIMKEEHELSKKREADEALRRARFYNTLDEHVKYLSSNDSANPCK